MSVGRCPVFELKVEVTFWEEAGFPIMKMLSKVPSVSEVVIPLNKLYAIASSKAQLVWTSGFEIIYWQRVSAGSRGAESVAEED